MKQILFIMLLISNYGNDSFIECPENSEKVLTGFIDRAFKIYGQTKPKPSIDYLEREDVGIRKRLKYDRFLCMEFTNKKFAEDYFKNWIDRAADPEFKTYYKSGINICLIKNYVIEERKPYNKNCDEERQTALENKLYNPYLRKNKKTFIRLKCSSEKPELK